MGLVTTVALMMTASAPVAGAETPNAIEIEKAIMSRRNRIVRGEVELRSEYWYRDRDGDRVTMPPTFDRIIFDGKKARSDEVLTPPAGTDPSAEVREVCCFSDEWFYWYEGSFQNGKRPMLLNVYDLDSFKSNARLDIPDPRLLGMIPTSAGNLVHYDGMEVIYGRPDRRRSSVERTSVNGVACWKVEYERNDGLVVRIWAAPERNYNVLRIELQGDSLLDTLESDVVKHQGSGLWFPEACHYWRTEQGERTNEEHLQVKVVQLNQPVDPKVFTLAGMEIQPGTPVIRHPDNEPGLIWNGEEIVQRKLYPGDIETPRSRRVGLIAGSIVFACLAAVAMWFLTRRKASIPQ